MSDADDSSQLAEDVRSALDEYASVYREAVRIAADGAPGNEVADLAVACWDGAVALRLVEADEVGFTTGAPPVVGRARARAVRVAGRPLGHRARRGSPVAAGRHVCER